MSLSVGIVGLPNVGKSTFFNAITNAGAQAQNYPFCTIEPNTGIVAIPDPRLAVLAKMSVSEKIIPSMITCIDIAGIVKGASKGEGLGNKFLSHIREVSAIAHVVRCFEDSNIVHVSGKVSPLDDIEIINTELILADLEQAEKMHSSAQKQIKSGGTAEEKTRHMLLGRIKEALERSCPARSLEFTPDEEVIVRSMNFITTKKVIYVANISEAMLGKADAMIDAVKGYAQRDGGEFTVICAKIEEEISTLEQGEKEAFLKELSIPESGLDIFAQKCFALLGLQSFLTTGPKETRAWTIHKGDTAPQAAGVIHTDFEKGFIRANIMNYTDLAELGSEKAVKEKGLMRQEGREYVMQDGDVVEFLFNV